MQAAIALLSGNLPAEPNSFIGRERDLAELARLLSEVRALTLSGPGGIGKTRLAVRLARDVMGGAAMGGSAMGGAAMGGSAMGSSAMGSSAMGSSAMGGTGGGAPVPGTPHQPSPLHLPPRHTHHPHP